MDVTIVDTTGQEIMTLDSNVPITDEQQKAIDAIDDRAVLSYLCEFVEGTKLGDTHDFGSSTKKMTKITITLI